VRTSGACAHLGSPGRRSTRACTGLAPWDTFSNSWESFLAKNKIPGRTMIFATNSSILKYVIRSRSFLRKGIELSNTLVVLCRSLELLVWCFQK
jgi:hypothetical protein